MLLLLLHLHLLLKFNFLQPKVYWDLVLDLTFTLTTPTPNQVSKLPTTHIELC
jgi:hypothetical protein